MFFRFFQIGSEGFERHRLDTTDDNNEKLLVIIGS